MTQPWIGAGLDSVAPSVNTLANSSVNLVRGTTSISWPNVAGSESVLSEVLPARTAGGFGFVKNLNAAYTNGQTLAEAQTTAGANGLRLQATASNQITLQYWNGASWVAVGSAITLTTSVTTRFSVDFSGLNTGSGALSFRAVAEGTETLIGQQSATGLTLTSIANMGLLKIYGGSTTNINVLMDMFVKDGSAHTAFNYVNRPTSNGIDATDGTGSYTDVDDVAGSVDTDLISLPTVGNKRSVKGAARVLLGRAVKGVAVSARLRCGATGPTQAKLYLVIGGTRYYHPTTLTLTTSFAPYSLTFELNPATSAAWLNAAAEAATLEWGVEVA